MNNMWVETAKITIWFYIMWFSAGAIGTTLIVIKNWESKPSFYLSMMAIFAMINIANVGALVNVTAFGGSLDYGNWQLMTLVLLIGIISLPMALNYKTMDIELDKFTHCFVSN